MSKEQWAEQAKNMVIKPDYSICMSNDLIMGKQSMGVNEAKILRLAIMQIVKEDKDLETYRVNLTDLGDSLGISRDNLYRDIRNYCINLIQHPVLISDGNPKHKWIAFPWVSWAEYDGNGTLIIRLHDKLKPYLLDLSKWYTQYTCDSILAMKSIYAIRLFEIIRAKMKFNKNLPPEGVNVEITVDEIRKACNCEKKFESFADLRRKVIEIAVREINEKSNLFVTYSYIKKARKVIGFCFTVQGRWTKDVVLSPEKEDYVSKQLSLFDISTQIAPDWVEY